MLLYVFTVDHVSCKLCILSHVSRPTQVFTQHYISTEVFILNHVSTKVFTLNNPSTDVFSLHHDINALFIHPESYSKLQLSFVRAVRAFPNVLGEIITIVPGYFGIEMH